jgi:hypothetical protein
LKSGSSVFPITSSCKRVLPSMVSSVGTYRPFRPAEPSQGQDRFADIQFPLVDVLLLRE